MNLIVPAEMTQPGRYRHCRIGKEWSEVWRGLECRYGGSDPDSDLSVEFRLTPAEDSHRDPSDCC